MIERYINMKKEESNAKIFLIKSIISSLKSNYKIMENDCSKGNILQETEVNVTSKNEDFEVECSIREIMSAHKAVANILNNVLKTLEDKQQVKKYKITNTEKVILELVSKQYKWIARDLDPGFLYVYKDKPEKGMDTYRCGLSNKFVSMQPFGPLLKMIQFDSGAVKISSILKNCEVIE